MSTEAVNEIAQGRVWTGSDALNLGLVDSLGSLNDAIESAAKQAKVSSRSLILIQTPRSERDKLLSIFTQSIATELLTQLNITPNSHIATWLGTLSKQAAQLNNYSDPQGLYVECLVCDIK